jgi:glutamyl/glutaminyl-tRNA synthetase
MSPDRVRVRFAPSPTGFLHLGGARTALYNWIYARRHRGDFVLRIEDTDPTRSTDEAIRQIVDSLHELGLDWDEGPDVGGPYGPYRQTQRQVIYEYLHRLVAGGHATPASPQEPRPSGRRRRREARLGSAAAVRPAGRRGERVVASEPAATRCFHRVRPSSTMLRTPVEFANETIGDFIVRRSDGTFTYNFAVVVDDVSMAISHVIHGDDRLRTRPSRC